TPHTSKSLCQTTGHCLVHTDIRHAHVFVTTSRNKVCIGQHVWHFQPHQCFTRVICGRFERTTRRIIFAEQGGEFVKLLNAAWITQTLFSKCRDRNALVLEASHARSET